MLLALFRGGGNKLAEAETTILHSLISSILRLFGHVFDSPVDGAIIILHMLTNKNKRWFHWENSVNSLFHVNVQNVCSLYRYKT